MLSSLFYRILLSVRYTGRIFFFLKLVFTGYIARPAGFLIMHFLLFELLTMSSLVFPLVLLRIPWESLEMIAGALASWMKEQGKLNT